jgi:hypothetical protein
METEYVNVLVIKDGAIEENILLCGLREHISTRAEATFREFGKRYISKWDEYTAEDVDACLDSGIAQFGNGSICINWPSNSNEHACSATEDGCDPAAPCARHRCTSSATECYCLTSGEKPSPQLAAHLCKTRGHSKA